MTTRRDDLLAWLDESRAVDEATFFSRTAFEDSWSVIGMELAWWHELFDYLDAHKEEVADADLVQPPGAVGGRPSGGVGFGGCV